MYRILQTVGTRITGSLPLCRLIGRLRKPGKEGTMTARPEGVAMLTDFDAERAGTELIAPEDRRAPAEGL